MRLYWAALACSCLVAAVTYGRLWSLPEHLNPWAALRYADAPNWLTAYKLGRLASEPRACQALLAETSWRYKAVADRDFGAGCSLRNAIRVERTALEVGQPFMLNCPAAVSLALWERHVLQPQAQAWFGMPLRRVEHLGSYACRNISGSPSERRSEHATANAFDVAGFVLQDGRRISVARDWNGAGANASFLQSVQRGACGLFTGVLGPDYNQAHADHLHLDRGAFRICR